MANVTAVKQVGRHKPGESFRVTGAERRALIALGMVRDEVKAAPAPKPVVAPPVAKVTRPYVRKDMVAAAPAPSSFGSTYYTKGE